VKSVSEVAYLESSALVKLAVVEEESRALQDALHRWPRRVSSRIAVVEVLRAVRRRDAARESLARHVLARVGLIAVGDHVLFAASQLDPATIRSLDAIHLATALRLGRTPAVFVSYDARQLAAAEALGLPVASPL
jgi:predicted nucleic acid-binding protein